MILAKKHIGPNGELVLALCDKDIFGSKFEEGDVVLDCTSAFYDGEETSDEDVVELLGQCAHANVVGAHAVRVTQGCIGGSPKTVEGVAYMCVFRIE